MRNTKEVLKTRAELALWLARKEAHRLRVEELKSRANCEQNSVDKLEQGGLFIRIKSLGRYEEKLERKMEEAEEVRVALEKVERLLTEAERKISMVEQETEKYEATWREMNKTALNDMEKQLLDWCETMELAYEVIALNHRCMEEGMAARLCAYSGPGDREKNLVFQEDVNVLMQKAEKFLSVVGRVRYLPGMRVKTVRGKRRNFMLNGKTLLFFWKEHPSTEIDILDFDLRELYGSWAVGDTLERKLKELDALEQLLQSIIEEKAMVGEELLEKLRREVFTSSEKNLFGFGKRKE